MLGEDELEDDGSSTHSSMADLIEDAESANCDQSDSIFHMKIILLRNCYL